MSSRRIFLLSSVILSLALASWAGAEDEKAGAAAGKCASPTGTLLQRSATGQAWQPVKEAATLAAGAHLLALPGEQGALSAGGGAVRISLHGNLPELSHFPVLESAITLNKPPAGVDADFTLQRGRVDVTNSK